MVAWTEGRRIGGDDEDRQGRQKRLGTEQNIFVQAGRFVAGFGQALPLEQW